MSNYRFAFLFDYSGFKEKITPALNTLIAGSSRELQKATIELVKENPEIWEFVEFSRVYYGNSETGIDDVINAGVLPWLLLVISNFCSNFSILDHRVLDSEILRETGLDEKTIDLLIDAKSLGDLLIEVAPKIVPTNYVKGIFNITDCPIGWLSFEDIQKIRAIIQANIEQTNIPAHPDLLIMLNNAVNLNKDLLLGIWFN